MVRAGDLGMDGCDAVIETIIPVLPPFLVSKDWDLVITCNTQSRLERALILSPYIYLIRSMLSFGHDAAVLPYEHNFRSSYLAGLSASLPITHLI